MDGQNYDPQDHACMAAHEVIKVRPALGAFYIIQPGNGSGLFYSTCIRTGHVVHVECVWHIKRAELVFGHNIIYTVSQKSSHL